MTRGAHGYAAAELTSKLIDIAEATRLVLERAAPLGPEPIAVRDALGRVLAEPIESADAVPGFDNSAMDGYAVRAADTAGASGEAPASLTLVDESRAGHPAAAALGPGEAIAISTGAMVPLGADAVVRVEDTDGARNGSVAVSARVEAGRDIRRAGEDISPGGPGARGRDRARPGRDRGARLGRARRGSSAPAGRGSRC